MKYKLVLILIIGNFLFPYIADAQLSPGPLAKAHSHLEGLSNCLECHVVGSKVSDQKCLDCHKELKKRIDQNKGYHSSNEIKSKNCSECHSDHHGLEFEMIRFDKESFDHDKTGYTLKGAHQTIDCRDCHKSDFIKDPGIRKLNNTFLGLSDQCLSCHEDYHQGTLDTDCLSCHEMQEFNSSPRFSHENTSFPLKGKHKNIDCAECHVKTTKNNREFQEFAGVASGNCTDCHNDVHKNTLGKNCTSCHSENSFTSINNRFDHDRTGYSLLGRHQSLDCKTCHDNTASLTTLFQEYDNVDPKECIGCHLDLHEGRFGTNCLECHSFESFSYVNSSEKFNHNMTSFPLEGAHAEIDCIKCHISGSMTDPVEHFDCRSCHENYHQESFSEGFLDLDCSQCHDVFSFAPSSFTIEQHDDTGFELKGAHEATPCIFCHLKNDEWEFKSLGGDCVSCHTDIHEGYLEERYYPENDCKVCHSEESWSTLSFDHAITGYTLEGAHEIVHCGKCHKPDIEELDSDTSPVFNVSSECRTCHFDNHRQQFEGPVYNNDCAICHGYADWTASRFDHDSSRFKLDGAHINVDCRECHYALEDKEGSYTLYKLNTIECSDCH